jgi:hypothetical protein
MPSILSYGGGRQTIAMCGLIARGVLPKPDLIVIADTGRENPSTWQYLDAFVRPMLAPLGLEVEIAPHSLATVDLFAKNGDYEMPLYTKEGMLPGYCSGEWKREVVARHLRAKGVTEGEMWIGFAIDEKRRIAKMTRGKQRGKFTHRFPLTELMLTTAGCLAFVKALGLPEPSISSCWMCPHKKNEEWRVIRDEHPPQFEEACQIDEELREEDLDRGGSGVWVHHSRTPLRQANLNTVEPRSLVKQCGLGMCFV